MLDIMSLNEDNYEYLKAIDIIGNELMRKGSHKKLSRSGVVTKYEVEYDNVKYHLLYCRRYGFIGIELVQKELST